MTSQPTRASRTMGAHVAPPRRLPVGPQCEGCGSTHLYWLTPSDRAAEGVVALCRSCSGLTVLGRHHGARAQEMAA